MAGTAVLAIGVLINYAGMFLRHGCGCKSENVYLWFAMGAHACNSIIAEPDTRGLKHIQGLPGSQNTWEDQISKQSHIVKPCVCVRAHVCVSSSFNVSEFLYNLMACLILLKLRNKIEMGKIGETGLY